MTDDPMDRRRSSSPRVAVALALLAFAGTALAQGPDVGTVASRPRRATQPVMNTFSVEIDREDPFQVRIFSDYGAVFVARNGAVPPPKIVFESGRDVAEWQSGLATQAEQFGEYEIELQAPAMEALVAAREEARAAGLDITARDHDAARRSYDETVSLWLSRVEPALEHWRKRKRLADEECERIRALDPCAQIPEILALEKKRIWFSTDFKKSILYSVAAPGTSQHLSMLAVDINEFDDRRVRAILARHGWFQTVVSDLPHFTFLGVDEEELPSLGLRRVARGGHEYWVPK
jgi:hypothetical protein